jgi:hypothetical protein
VPTRIIFTAQGKDGRPLSVNVAQNPGDVLTGLSQAQGQPFALQRASNGEQVYVNPNMVAFFEEASGAGATGGRGATKTR